MAGLILGLGIGELGLRLTAIDLEKHVDSGKMRPAVELGWEYVPNQTSVVSRPDIRTEAVVIRVNSRGFREDQEISPAKHPSCRRVLVVGDSQAAGEYCDNKETFANLAETFLQDGTPRFEVINASVPAYSPVQSWLRFRTEKSRLSPDAVVMVLYPGNDLLELLEREQPSPRPFWEVKTDGSLGLRLPALDVPDNRQAPDRAQSLEQMIGRLKLVTLVRKAVPAMGRIAPAILVDKRWKAGKHCHGCLTQSLSQSTYFLSKPEEIRLAFRLLKHTLEQLKVDSIGAGLQLETLLIPTKLQIEATLEPALPATLAALGLSQQEAADFDKRIYMETLELCRQLGIKALDTLPALSEAHHKRPGEELYFSRDWHLSPDGHRVIGRLLAAELQKIQWVQ